MSRKCVKIFRTAQSGIWKPEEISLLEGLLDSKATILRNDYQNIFFCDIDFTDLNVAMIKVSLVTNKFVPELFQVCESELPDLSLQEEEKGSRTIIVEKDANHAFGFTVYFDDTPDLIGRGRSEAEAIGSLILCYRIPSQSPSYTGCVPAETSLGINIVWGHDSQTVAHIEKLRDHHLSQGSGNN